MYEIKFYTNAEISLSEIAQVAEKANYKLRKQGDNELFVYLWTDSDSLPKEEICRWYTPSEAYQIIPRRIKRLDKLSIKPKTILFVECKHPAISYLASLLRMVLEKYGGCVETNMSYEMLTLKEVGKLLLLPND